MRSHRRNEYGGGVPDQPGGNDEDGTLPLDDADDAGYGRRAGPERKRPDGSEKQNTGRDSRECAVG